MYAASLYKIPTHTVDFSQVLAEFVRQKQPQKIKSFTKKIGTKYN